MTRELVTPHAKKPHENCFKSMLFYVLLPYRRLVSFRSCLDLRDSGVLNCNTSCYNLRGAEIFLQFPKVIPRLCHDSALSPKTAQVSSKLEKSRFEEIQVSKLPIVQWKGHFNIKYFYIFSKTFVNFFTISLYCSLMLTLSDDWNVFCTSVIVWFSKMFKMSFSLSVEFVAIDRHHFDLCAVYTLPIRHMSTCKAYNYKPLINEQNAFYDWQPWYGTLIAEYVTILRYFFIELVQKCL